MNKVEIIQQLKERHENFISTIDSLNESDFLFTLPEKWNAGQQLDHIYRSVATLQLAMRIPKPAMKIVIGKANRPSRSYDALVERYIFKLSGGAKATGRFVPSNISFDEKNKLIEKIRVVVEKLSNRINEYSEEDLDELILPHPLMGKLTMREMMFFTIYHVQHHQRLAIKNLELRK
jgi:hypothetical protein